MKSLCTELAFDLPCLCNSIINLNIYLCYSFSTNKNKLTDIHIDNIDLYLKDSFIDIAEKYYVYVFNK